MLDEIGGFDEDLFAYGDDAELGLRARIAGWRCIYSPNAVVYHHRAMTLGKSSWRRIALIERNRVLLAARHFPLTLLWRNFYYYILRIAGGMRAAAHNQGEAVLYRGVRGKVRLAWGLFAGDVSALWRLPATIRKRISRSEAAVSGTRRLTARGVHRLILENGISVREISTAAVLP
jgi:GT2 family glycosyltransferase